MRQNRSLARAKRMTGENLEKRVVMFCPLFPGIEAKLGLIAPPGEEISISRVGGWLTIFSTECIAGPRFFGSYNRQSKSSRSVTQAGCLRYLPGQPGAACVNLCYSEISQDFWATMLWHFGHQHVVRPAMVARDNAERHRGHLPPSAHRC